MKFRLSEIKKPRELEARIGAMELELGYRFQAHVAPTRLDLVVAPKGSAHRLEGIFVYEATVPCSRCLKQVGLAGKVEFMQEYRPLMRALAPVEEIEVTPQDDFLVAYEDDTLVAEDLVRQQLYIELPEKPLCDEACKGLCTRCGADLNEGPCGCPSDGEGAPASGAPAEPEN